MPANKSKQKRAKVILLQLCVLHPHFAAEKRNRYLLRNPFSSCKQNKSNRVGELKKTTPRLEQRTKAASRSGKEKAHTNWK